MIDRNKYINLIGSKEIEERISDFAEVNFQLHGVMHDLGFELHGSPTLKEEARSLCDSTIEHAKNLSDYFILNNLDVHAPDGSINPILIDLIDTVYSAFNAIPLTSYKKKLGKIISGPLGKYFDARYKTKVVKSSEDIKTGLVVTVDFSHDTCTSAYIANTAPLLGVFESRTFPGLLDKIESGIDNLADYHEKQNGFAFFGFNKTPKIYLNFRLFGNPDCTDIEKGTDHLLKKCFILPVSAYYPFDKKPEMTHARARL